MGNTKNRNIEKIKQYNSMLEKQMGCAVRPYRFDGYVNMLNKYGTAKDTTEHYQYNPEPIVADDTLSMFYESNGLFSKIIDTPAEEAVKHGFELEEISDQNVELFMKDSLDLLDWEENAMTAIKWARLFGGSIIVMLIDDGGGLEDKLNWRNIRSVEDLRVYDRSLIQPDYSSMYDYDPSDQNRIRGSRLGMPEYYTVTSQYGTFKVHESRCLVFQNGLLPESTTNSIYQMWGVPEYLRIHRAIRDAEIAHGSGPKMLDRSIQAIYKMKNLSEVLSTDEGEDFVLRRLQTIDMARGMLNSITIDSEGEDYDFRTFQFAGVADIINTACNYLSALTSIPQTILFGRSPAGMNATGDSDLENYYNFVERIQKRMLRSNLRYLLSIIFKAGLKSGEIEEMPKISVKFNPLWSMSEGEQAALDLQKAQIQQTKAATAQIYVGMQALDPSEIRKKLAETEEFDVEDILDDYDEDELFEQMNAMAQQSPMGGEQPGMGMAPGQGQPTQGAQSEQAETAPAEGSEEPTEATVEQQTTLLETGEKPEEEAMDSNFDDENLDEIDWITVNGTHVPIEDGVALGGGKLKGKSFSKAKSQSQKKSVSPKIKKLTSDVDEIKKSDKSKEEKYKAYKKLVDDCEVGTEFKVNGTEYRKGSDPDYPIDVIDFEGKVVNSYTMSSVDYDLKYYADEDNCLSFFDKSEEVESKRTIAKKMKESGKFSTSDSVHSEKTGKITESSPDFGSAGNYVVYRNGNIGSSGMIFFAAKKEGADSYAFAHDYGNTKEYEVELHNPLVIRGETDVACIKKAYATLHPDKQLKGDMTSSKWISCDKANASALNKGVGEYDSIVYIIRGKPAEVQVSAKKAKTSAKNTGEYTTTDWSRGGHTYEEAVMRGYIDETAEDYKKVESNTDGFGDDDFHASEARYNDILDNSDGGPGSGNHGHKGVKGQVGGSAPATGSDKSYASKEDYINAKRNAKSKLESSFKLLDAEHSDKVNALKKKYGNRMSRILEVKKSESLSEEEKDQKIKEIREDFAKRAEELDALNSEYDSERDKIEENYRNTFEPDYEYEKIAGNHSLKDDVNSSIINPQKLQGNCQRCAIAFEMRRRGFDVTVTEGNYSLGAWSNINSCFSNTETKDYFSYDSDVITSDVCNQMLDWGDGARAIVYANFEDDGYAHAYNLEVKGGEVFVADSQIGAVYSDRTSLEARGKINLGMDGANFVSLIRTDKAKPCIDIESYVRKV